MYRFLAALILFVSISFISVKGQTPLWGFKIGSGGVDAGQACIVNHSGNVVVAGKFSGTVDLDPGVGVHNITSLGATDIFLACYTPAGGFLWGFGVGGSNFDGAVNVAVDLSDNVIVCGYIQSAVDFDPGPGVTSIPFVGGTSVPWEGDGFVAKYSSTGAFQWARGLGGPLTWDRTGGVGTDDLGNVYVGGCFNTTLAVAGGPTFTLVAGNAYLIKYSPAGAVVWAHAYGQISTSGTGTEDCGVNSLVVRGNNVYVGGWFTNTANFSTWTTPTLLSTPGPTNYDGYIAKYDATTGDCLFARQITGAGQEKVTAVCLDADENIYVTGATYGTSVTFSPTSAPITCPGSASAGDILLAKYNSSGACIWGEVFGGPGEDVGFGIDVVGSMLYTTGQMVGTVDFDASAITANLVSAGSMDMYLTKYDLDGNYLCGFRVGTATIDDLGNGVSHDAAGNVYTTGQFGGAATDFDPSSVIYPLSSAGNTDAYLVKYTPDCAVTAPLTCDVVSLPDTITLCQGDTTTMPASIAGSNPVISILWTPATGLSSTTILHPLLTAVTSGMYYLTVGSLFPGNLITNGDFSAGTAGFSTAYASEVPPSSTPGHYDIFTNPSVYPAFPSFGDHTTGSGNMMLVDGSSTPGVSFWCSTVSVLPSTDYHFSVWTALAHNPLPSIQLSINGTPLGTFTTTAIQGEWVQYQVTWNSGAATTATICMQDLSTVAFGNDFVIDDISFQRVCKAEDSVYLKVTPPSLDIHVHDTTVCSTAFPVTLTVYSTVSGHTWNTGSTASTISISDTGTYWVVYAAVGCVSRVDTIHVHSVLPSSDIHVHDTTVCSTSLPVELTAYGTATGHTWSNGSTSSSTTVSDTGTYWVISSAVDCSYRVDTIHVHSVLPSPDIHVHDTTVCSASLPVDLTAYVTATGYTWSTGSTSSSATVSDTGTYWIISSAVDCAYRIDTIHLHSVLPTQDIHIHDTTVCSASVPVTLTEPVFPGYTWSTGSTASSISVSAAGTYWVRTSVVSCAERIDTFKITLTAPTQDIHIHDSAVCSASAPVTLDAPAGFAGYTWNTSSTTSSISISSAGTYWVATSVVSCAMRIDTFHVTFTPPTQDIHIHDTVLCAALAPITLSAPAGFPGYTWNTGATTSTISAGTTGSFWVKTSVVSCTVRTDTFHVVIHPMPVVSLGNDTAFCIGNTHILSSPQPPGSFYLWSTGSTGPSLPVSSTGSYTLTVTNSYGCVSSDNINITVSPHPVVNLGPDTTICTGSSVTLFSSVPYISPAYYWNDGSTGAIKTVAASGTYWLKVTVAGCSGIDTAHLVIIYDTLTLHNTDTAICLGMSVQALAEGTPELHYQWAPTTGMSVSNVSSPLITPDTSAMYVLTAFLPGCPPKKDSFFIDVQPIPDVFVSNNRQVCKYDTIHIAPVVKPEWYTGYHYSWSPSANLDNAISKNVIFTAGDTTQLILTVTTSAGCKGKDSTIVNVYPVDFATVRGDTTVCPHDSVRLWAAGGVSYKWSPSLYLDSTASAAPIARAITNQVYTVLATSSFGCHDTLAVHINVRPDAVIHMPDSVTISTGETYHIMPQTNCTSFLWSPSGGLDNRYAANPVANPESSTRYIVRGTTEWGCVTMDTINIIIDPNAIIALPNAFAPESSKLFVLKKGLVHLRHFRIYNRWGNVVFETTNIEEGWDGTYKGTPQPLDVFVYTIEAETANGDVITKAGNVTLLR